MAAPTRVQSVAIAYASHSSGVAATSATFNVLNGDLLVVRGMSEDSAVTLTISDNTSGALTWTLQQSDLTASHAALYEWTAAVAADRTGVTVSLTQSVGVAKVTGGRITTWRGHGGVGTFNKATGTTAPSVVLTGVGANSAIDAECADWNAGAATATWGGTATATSETATQAASACTFYEAYYADTGASGNKTVSMASVPAGAVTTILALEIKGGTGATPVTVTPAAATAVFTAAAAAAAATAIAPAAATAVFAAAATATAAPKVIPAASNAVFSSAAAVVAPTALAPTPAGSVYGASAVVSTPGTPTASSRLPMVGVGT